MNKTIIKIDGTIIIDGLQNHKSCRECIDSYHKDGYAHIVCPIDNEKKRIAYYKNNNGILYACSHNSKTTKLFKEEVASIGYTLKALVDLHIKIVNEAQNRALLDATSRVDRVIHNLKSINAHAIQELYTLIPQDQLTNNIRETSKIVEEYIKQDLSKASLTFLRMAKLNLSIKAEFSIYEKLLKGKPQLDFRNHNIRDVIMIVLYMFFIDFNEKNVWVKVDNFYEKALFDFESVQVAIYHIIENAAKYIAPNSIANIFLKKERDSFIITFSMLSLYINPEEDSDIFKEGYSGVLAKQTRKAGQGIGMYRAKKLINLNNGDLYVEAGDKQQYIQDVCYANNNFIIKLPSA